MTDDKIREVLDLYEEKLSRHNTPQELFHLRTMIPRVRAFVDEGRRDKAFRWLGFMQGVFWAYGVYTLDQLKDHNRPAAECCGKGPYDG